MCAGDPIRPNYAIPLFVPTLGNLFIPVKKDEKRATSPLMRNEESIVRSLSAPSFNPFLRKDSERVYNCQDTKNSSKLLSEVDRPSSLNALPSCENESFIHLPHSCDRISSDETKIHRALENPKRVQFRVAKTNLNLIESHISCRLLSSRSKNYKSKSEFLRRITPIFFHIASQSWKENRYCDNLFDESNNSPKSRVKGRRGKLKNYSFPRFQTRKRRKLFPSEEVLRWPFSNSEVRTNSNFYVCSQYKNYSSGGQSKESNDMRSSKFPRRKPSRRNSTSQLYSDSGKDSTMSLKTTERRNREVESSASFEDFLSAKSKFRKKSEEESSREASQNTIKLIDKYLSILSTDKPPKPPPYRRSRSTYRLQSSIESKDSLTPQYVSKKSMAVKASVGPPKMSLPPERNQEKIPTIKQSKKYLSTSTQSLNILGRHCAAPPQNAPRGSSLNRQQSSSQNNSEEAPVPMNPSLRENEHQRRSRMYSSLDGLTSESDGFGERLLTAAFLARIDNVLSDLVEEEKQKIKRRNSQSLHASYEAISFPRQQLKEDKWHRKYASQNIVIKVKPVLPTDILDKHKQYFTAKKQFYPRILKREADSKLKPYRVYQVMRPRRKKKKKKKIEDTTSKYSDDFEASNSSGDATSSDQESIEENLNHSDSSSSLDFSREGDKEFLTRNGTEPNAIVEDEEDTCYGSDQVSSDLMNEQADSFKEGIPLPIAQRDCGDFSIDSAYTGSREATPDIKNRGLSSKLKKVPVGCADIFSSVPKRYSLVQQMNDCKRFLLEKIKDSGMYSDSHINALLEYYSRKWTHIPEREMQLIVGFIRRDLGVAVPPKTCINYLLTEDEPDKEKPNVGLSTEKCIVSLTSTLPRYLKMGKTERKALSASCSPEPPFAIFNKGKSTSSSPESSVSFTQRRKSSKLTAKSRFLESVKDIDVQGTDNASLGQNLYPFDQTFKEDEEWIRETCGDEVLKSVKDSLPKIDSTPPCNLFTSSEDIEKMASDICDQFGLVL